MYMLRLLDFYFASSYEFTYVALGILGKTDIMFFFVLFFLFVFSFLFFFFFFFLIFSTKIGNNI